jgi:transcriptional regulator with XRE-family HTH domain
MSVVNQRILLVREKIRERRELLNYTQEYVAHKLNISQNAYSKIECGHSSLNIERLLEIALVLKADINQFLG